MTQEDILFERFQTMTVFALREELNKIKQDKKKGNKLHVIVNNIMHRYGSKDNKINFIQNLRSREDYIYKHSLNVAILAAMMSHVLNIKREDQMNIITAALVHDVGKMSIPPAEEVVRSDEQGLKRRRGYPWKTLPGSQGSDGG